MTQTTNDGYKPPETLYTEDFEDLRDDIASYAWSHGGSAYFNEDETIAGLPDATVYLRKDQETEEVYVEVEKKDLAGKNTWSALRDKLMAEEDDQKETSAKLTADQIDYQHEDQQTAIERHKECISHAKNNFQLKKRIIKQKPPL